MPQRGPLSRHPRSLSTSSTHTCGVPLLTEDVLANLPSPHSPSCLDHQPKFAPSTHPPDSAIMSTSQTDHQRELALREKELELQIAQERRKEREAELAILQLRRELEQSRRADDGSAPGVGVPAAALAGASRARTRQGSASRSVASPSRAQPAFSNTFSSAAGPLDYRSNGPMLGPTRSTAFTPAMAYGGLNFASPNVSEMDGINYPPAAQTTGLNEESSSLDMANFNAAFSPDFFNWLPDLGVSGFGSGSGGATGGQEPQASSVYIPAYSQQVDPAQIPPAAPEVARLEGIAQMTPGQELEFAQFQQDLRQTAPLAGADEETGMRSSRMSHRVDPSILKDDIAHRPSISSEQALSPPQAGPSSHKKGVSKKETVTVSASCSSCTRPLCKLLVRNPAAHALGVPGDFTASDLSPHFYCLTCAVYNLPDRKLRLEHTAAEEGVTTLAQRKRTRVGEDKAREEEEGGAGALVGKSSRTICDVCQRTIGAGWLDHVEHGSQASAGPLAMEVVCASCDDRYSRCAWAITSGWMIELTVSHL